MIFVSVFFLIIGILLILFHIFHNLISEELNLFLKFGISAWFSSIKKHFHCVFLCFILCSRSTTWTDKGQIISMHRYISIHSRFRLLYKSVVCVFKIISCGFVFGCDNAIIFYAILNLFHHIYIFLTKCSCFCITFNVKRWNMTKSIFFFIIEWIKLFLTAKAEFFLLRDRINYCVFLISSYIVITFTRFCKYH